VNALRDKYGAWACVVGSAQGLGLAFAENLAKRGFSLILIDIDQQRLDETCTLLKSKYQSETSSLHLDLEDQSTATVIADEMKKYQCRFMVYNAAFGPVKPFLVNSAEELHRYIAVNVETQLHIIHQFIKQGVSKPAGIMMISSLAGFRGTQYVIPYAATKAFIWNMAEGLHYEFKNTALDVSVCVAGATDTPNFRSTNPRVSFLSPMARNPHLVAEESLRRFGKQLFIVPGFGNKFAHFLLNRILPRSIASKLHNYTMCKMYG